MSASLSRRAFCATVAATAKAAERPVALPGEFRRFRDSATEFELTRYTDPAKASAILPVPPLRAISSHNNFLVYSSNRSGSMQVFRMDLKTGENRQWSQASALDPQSVCLAPDEKGILYVDGNQIVLHGAKVRTLYTTESDWAFARPFAVSDDGATAALVEQRNGRFRLRVVGLTRPSANTIFEASEPLQFARIRPRRQQILYNHAGVLTLVNWDGRGSKRLNPGENLAGFALWSADGRAVHYLSIPRERGLIQMREHLPDTGEDKLIGPTTQFTSFARNADSSVFAGISGSKAAPYILLLVRAAHRELTVAEHRASSADHASVCFSPNSQRIFYCSDREGKPAIYGIALDRFVEETETPDRASLLLNPA